MVKTKRVNDLRGYTPYGARALHEFDVRDEFFGQSGIGIRFFILILPKAKNGTMLDEKVLDEAVEVDNIIQKNLTIYNRITNKEESYNQVCRRFCTINDPVSLFAIGWKEQQENLRNGEPLNEKTRLDYPFSKVMDMNVNLQLSFFGVEFGNSRNYTNMEKVEMIVLLYRAERIGGWTNEDISNYEMSVSNYFKNNFTGKYIRVLSISTSYAQVEFDRSGKILITFVSVGLIIMCLASLLSNSLSATFMRQFSFYKFPVALFACLCPLMASGTALGGDVITMEAEKRLKEQQRKQIDSSLAKQLTEVLEETGPAIMISALTNISSDIIGSFTGSPEITLLCVGNIASITVDFFYQITLFTSVSNIWASIFICFVWLAVLLICIKALTQFEINLTTKKLFPPDSPLLEIENYREEKVLPFYTQAQIFIENPGDLTNKKRRKHLDNLIDEMEHLPNAYPAESSFYFVRAFEAFEKSLSEGDGGEFIDDNSNLTTTTAISSIPKTQNFDLTDLENFLLWPENTHWKGLINYHTDNLKNESELTTQLDSLMVTVAYHGEELKDWHYRALMLNQWRSVVDKYNEEFNVTVLHDDGLYLDLLENMPTDIWQSAVATLICMAIICALFMGSNFFVVCVTTGVIASICAETLGILSLTGMSMDPVLMSAVIISIGFSVDIPAHVSYHFHTAKWEDEDNNGNQKTRKTPRSIPERVQRAFSSVGFPALQASACTNACALALLFLPLYIAQVFARVILICITLGTIHSLLLLPALFTIVASVENFYDKYFGENTVKLINGKKELKKQNSSFRV
uniref:SSD domain-containing protein n=2 Tax=Meloidogyne incognita group TaxID=654580 RepID=A0A915MWZ8_MELJA